MQPLGLYTTLQYSGSTYTHSSILLPKKDHHLLWILSILQKLCPPLSNTNREALDGAARMAGYVKAALYCGSCGTRFQDPTGYNVKPIPATLSAVHPQRRVRYPKPPPRVRPAMLCPPPLMQSKRSCSRANLTQWMTSALPMHRTTNAGCLSIMAFHTVLESSYPASPGTNTGPLRSICKLSNASLASSISWPDRVIIFFTCLLWIVSAASGMVIAMIRCKP